MNLHYYYIFILPGSCLSGCTTWMSMGLWIVNLSVELFLPVNLLALFTRRAFQSAQYIHSSKILRANGCGSLARATCLWVPSKLENLTVIYNKCKKQENYRIICEFCAVVFYLWSYGSFVKYFPENRFTSTVILLNMSSIL